MKASIILLTLTAIQASAWMATAFLMPSPKSSQKGLLMTEINSEVENIVNRRTNGRAATFFEIPKGKSMRTDEQMSSGFDEVETLPIHGITLKKMEDIGNPITVQGGSLRTWAFERSKRVQVSLKTLGRPFDATVDLWNGPDNSPFKMKIFVEDGVDYPFNAVIEAPNGSNTVAVRNIGELEFPMEACLEGIVEDREPELSHTRTTIQGGALRTFSFESVVKSVAVKLDTNGRPLNARIELMKGPNHNKQIIEVYSEDGLERPFFVVLATPSQGHVIRVINTSYMEMPLEASVEPYEIGADDTLELGPEEGRLIGADTL